MKIHLKIVIRDSSDGRAVKNAATLPEVPTLIPSTHIITVHDHRYL